MGAGEGRVSQLTDAELHEIKARYAHWEIIGPAEIRDVNPCERYFTTHQREAPSGIGNLGVLLKIGGGRAARRVTVAGVAT